MLRTDQFRNTLISVHTDKGDVVTTGARRGISSELSPNDGFQEVTDPSASSLSAIVSTLVIFILVPVGFRDLRLRLF